MREMGGPRVAGRAEGVVKVEAEVDGEAEVVMGEVVAVMGAESGEGAEEADR